MIRDVKRFSNIAQKTIDQSAPMREALLEMADDAPETMETPEGKEVQIGQALLFVNLSPFQTLAQTDILNELTATSTDLVLGGDGEETLWSRIKMLAQGFVDGVLQVAGVQTDKLCIGETCVDEATLKALLESSQQTPTTYEQGSYAPEAPQEQTNPESAEESLSQEEIVPEEASSTPEEVTTPDPTTTEDISVPQEEESTSTEESPVVEEPQSEPQSTETTESEIVP